MDAEPISYPGVEAYGNLFALTRERPDAVPEQVVQCVWYDQLFATDTLRTSDGMPIRVISPGWWNDLEGPDFRGAQIQFGDTVRTGDVEIHLDHGGWRQHGHHTDPRYDNVILEVVLTANAASKPSTTASGRPVACLLLANHLDDDCRNLAQTLSTEDYPHGVTMTEGYCAAMSREHGVDHIHRFLLLAGEWRLLQKARGIQERMMRAGPDQAVYEAFLVACGYSRFKHHFASVARSLPYERIRQLARQDPMLVEAALLQIAGLLPDELPEPVPHFRRLSELRRVHLEGLRRLPLQWPRTGVRPNNYPERRIAGAARFLTRTSRTGLASALGAIWREECAPLARRRAFEALFQAPWASGRNTARGRESGCPRPTRHWVQAAYAPSSVTSFCPPVSPPHG